MKLFLRSLVLLTITLCISPYALAISIVVDGLHYTIQDNYCKLTAIDEDIEILKIPQFVEWDGEVYEVNALGNECCSKSSVLKEVKIEAPILSIPQKAFYSCNNLETVQIPETVLSIGAQAFMSCKSLTTITLPEGLKSIEEKAFGSTGLKELIIPESIEKIGDYSFSIL